MSPVEPVGRRGSRLVQRLRGVRLATDIGRVLTNGSHLINTDRHLETPEMPGAFDALHLLNRILPDSIDLVSRCEIEHEQNIVHWLQHHRFVERTGIHLTDHLFFCRARKDKAGIVRRLGTTHMVDNRPDVLAPMAGIVPVRMLLLPAGEVQDYPHRWHLDGLVFVDRWDQVVGVLLEDGLMP